VDNTSRTFHGALLDAGLLAEVYIRMTRGQNALVIEEEEEVVVVEEVPAIDLTQFVLPVVRASEPECEAHETLLAELGKASGGVAQWKKFMP
jgi:DNA polymerase-3 subunit epsilon